MRYSEASGEIAVTVDEMVAFSLFHYVGTAAGEELLPVRRADRATRGGLGLPEEQFPVERVFSSGEHTFRLTAAVDRYDAEGRERRASLAFVTADDPQAPDAATVRAARGEAYLLAAALPKTPTEISITYYNEALDTHATVTESVSRKRLESFFERAATALSLYASSEIVRVTRRMPMMKRLAFPYGEPRLGQEALMRSVYRAVRRGRRLYASAPTGIGKTVSTLYPAIRAMGEGHCDKIFYLTAKATAAKMAGKTAELLGREGAVRTVLLASKERLCSQRGTPCREGRPCGRTRGGAREDRALTALLELGRPLIGPDEIRTVAEAHGVCPHELSLRYSMLSDVIICDYNYLFDPAVRLSRYFSLGGRYAFLIDEAHNLGDRIRDTYAVRLSEASLRALPIPEPTEATSAPAEAHAAREELLSFLVALAPKEEEIRRSLPEGLPTRVSALLRALGRLMRDRHPSISREMRTHIRAFYYETKTILDVLSAYDDGFRLRLSPSEQGVLLDTLCLDPAGIVGRCLGDGRSAVLFSATLRPIAYYRDLLGGEGEDEMLELNSPFEQENLAVAVMDKISTRYTDREETLSAVAGAVVATARARRGNYMVFAPSLSYAEMLEDALHRAAPELRIIRQGRSMTSAARAAFLAEFEKPEDPVVALCVMGGIWGEGIDLVGRRLIGAVIIGVGLGTPDPGREEIARYYQEKSENGREYAYIYPGMNRVLQAAGRVIRDEGDVGVVVLIDDRFATPLYRSILPDHWHGLSYVGNNRSLSEYLRRFWCRHPEDSEDEKK